MRVGLPLAPGPRAPRTGEVGRALERHRRVVALRAIRASEGQAAWEELEGDRVEARHAALLVLLVVDLAVESASVDPLAAVVHVGDGGHESLRERLAGEEVDAVAVGAAAGRAQGDPDVVVVGGEAPGDGDLASACPDAAAGAGDELAVAADVQLQQAA